MLHRSRLMRVLVLGAAVGFAVAGCTRNIPGKLLASTVPIDDHRRINIVGKEAFGSSCQWWVSGKFRGFAFEFPLPMPGNQNYMSLDDALGEEYDGLVQAALDTRITPYGIAIPTEADPDPRKWLHIFFTSVCQEIRGKPFVFTQPLRGTR